MWFWFALAGALTSAVSIVLNKKALEKVGAPLLTWSLFSLSLPLIGYLALKDGIPRLNTMFFIVTLASAFIFVFSKTLVNDSFKKGTLSKVIPLTSFSTLFSYVLALIFLGENITFIAFMGLLLIVLGSYILNVEKAREGIFKPFYLLLSNRIFLLYLLAMLLSSFSTLLDKIGLLNTVPRSPSFVLLVENIAMSTLLGVYMIKKEKGWTIELKKHFPMLLINSLVYALVTLLVVTSFLGPLALATAIKRLEVIFVLVLGVLFLHDKPTKFVLLGALLMLIGAILIKIS